MNMRIFILTGLLVCFSAGTVYAGKPIAETGKFTAETSGAINGFWTSKEYKYSDKTTGINFNAHGGTAYLYFSHEFIHEFDEYTPDHPDHEEGAGHECFGNGDSGDFLGGTAQIQKMGFGKNSDLVMGLWIHADNANPDDEEIIFYVLELYNADEPAWDGGFPPNTSGSVNYASSWNMRTTSNSYLKLDPCLGSGDSFPGGEDLEITIKRLR
jgi:hypothetical protein